MEFQEGSNGAATGNIAIHTLITEEVRLIQSLA